MRVDVRVILRRLTISALLCAGIFVVLFSALPFVPTAHAASALTANELFGGAGATGSSFASELGLASSSSLTELIVRLIRTVIGFIGIIVVVLFMLAGFKYMTAAGDAKKIEGAKKIMKSAIVGLVIILSSFMIVQYILGLVVGATGGGVINGDNQPPGAFEPGQRNSTFLLSSVNTQCAETLRNFQLQLVFSQDVKAATVEQGISVTQAGQRVQGVFATNGSLVTFTPSAQCPDPNAAEHCFDANTVYELTVNPAVVQSTNDKTLRCPADAPCGFSFRTGENVDIGAPTLVMTAPDPIDDPNVFVGVNELLQAETHDDVGVSTVNFYVIDDRSVLYTSGVNLSSAGHILGGNQANFFNTDPNEEWDTSGYVPNQTYDLWASASDCAGHPAVSRRVTVTMRAATCSNGVRDADLGETDIDCGGDPRGANFCGACDGGQCAANADCASGQCVNGQCVASTYISQVSPGDGAVGNLITIKGRGFGAAAGRVTFLGADAAGDEFFVAPYECNARAQWSDREVVVQVPAGVLDGAIRIENAANPPKSDQTDNEVGPFISDFDVNLIQRPGICALNPESAASASPVTVTGLGLGAARGASTFYFGSYEPTAYQNWSNTETRVVVPNADAGLYSAQVFTGIYRCVDANGAATNRACEQTADCQQAQGETCGRSWCTETLAYCTDDASCGANGGRCVSVRVGSNTRSFTVLESQANTQPIISSVESGWRACLGGGRDGDVCGVDADCIGGGVCKDAPNWGPVGQYITIYGSNFGSALGTVELLNQGEGRTAIGDIVFPAFCSMDTWGNNAITVKVPATYQNAAHDAIAKGLTHALRVVRHDTRTSNQVDFVVINGNPGPSMCQMSPVAGPVGTEVTIRGENFGDDDGAVSFFNNRDGNYRVWANTEILDAAVPDQSTSGPVRVRVPGGFTSNSMNFTVGDCREDAALCTDGTQCCADGSCAEECSAAPPEAHVAYKVSTGPIPLAPVVMNRCDNQVISPSPSLGHSPKENICLNAVITASFGVPAGDRGELVLAQMDAASMAGGVLVEHCTTANATTDNCRAWEPLAGVVRTDASSFTFTPAARFASNGIYRVTLKGGGQAGDIRAAVPANPPFAYLEQDYQWVFQASSDQADCQVGSVNVSPSALTATENLQDGYGYSAQLIARNDRCVVLECQGSSLAWESNQPNRARVDVALPPVGECTNRVFALDETPQGDPAEIHASVVNADTHPGDDGALTIDFSDPQVRTYFPNCQEACVNVLPTVTFNTRINVATLVPANVLLFKCQNALCAEDGLVNVPLAQLRYDEAARKLSFVLPANVRLTANSWYRIRLLGRSIRSNSNVPLSSSGSNFGSDMNPFYPGDFSWKFRTKVSDVSCAIDRVIVEPPTVDLKFVGDRQEYSATAHGAPDECSAVGQSLQDDDWSWDAWSAQDTPNRSAGSPVDVATVLQGGSIQLAGQLPAWCTASCLNAGSSLVSGSPICGDGILDYDAPLDGVKDAEECEDGNTVSGDGCSSSCLMEGNPVAWTPNAGAGTCGDGFIDAREQCDDGNLNDADGCSSRCLNRGSASVRSTCGDGSVDFAQHIGGEDCDDGNAVGGDGCSSQCLFEGAIARERVYAVCGNNIHENGEDCDDGNHASGDGCSERCLNEGSASIGKDCGDGFRDFDPHQGGEDCDDSNTQNGDGCSSQCLKEGATAFAPVPTFCGDRVVGATEECEAPAGAAVKVRGYSVAQVMPNASKEVDPQTHYAVSTITATATGKSGQASLRLQCSCQTDSACGNNNALGCGASNCCYARPTHPTIVPASNLAGPGYCRNTAVTVTFNQLMDDTTFGSIDSNGDGQVSGAELQGNISLRLVQLKQGAAFVKVDAQNSRLCPEPYFEVSYGGASGSVLARAWSWVKNTVFTLLGRQAQAGPPPYGCYVPLNHDAIIVGDKHQVSLRFDRALESDAIYEVSVLGDTNLADGVKNGVLSADQVGLASATFTQRFLTGNQICTLDAVQVEDLGKSQHESYESPSANFFSRKDEEHTFTARSISNRPGGLTEEIQPMQNVYAWTWGWGSSIGDGTAESVVMKKAGDPVNNALSPSRANFSAQGVNGQETVTASAQITVDRLNNPAPPLPSVSGSTDVFALMCENPWPSIGVAPWKPFREDVKKTYFSLFYCRDDGEDGVQDDLPGIAAPIYAQDSAFLQEMIFNVQGTKDAIGVRVLPNPKYLTPEEWFKAQRFVGTASSTQVDGYPAVQSGNTIYVAAANNASDARGIQTVYSNIYAISFSPEAGEPAREIFSRVLQNFRFNANTQAVSNIRLCKVGNSYVSTGETFHACSWDGDCVDHCTAEKTCSASGASCQSDNDCPLKLDLGASCDANKDKLQRDLKRLLTVKSIAQTLNEYGSQHGHCAVSKEQSCSRDNQCPGAETCLKTYPTISSGTFIPSLSTSKWPSWTAQLSNTLTKGVPQDPINAFYNDCTVAGYDSASCWNASTSQFMCPAKSQIFGYRSLGQEKYQFFGQLEYDRAPWSSAIDPRVCEDGHTLCMSNDSNNGQTSSDCLGIGDGVCGADPVRDTAEIHMQYHHVGANPPAGVPSGFDWNNSFCDARNMAAEGVCGDGIISAGERCEIGETTTAACQRDLDPGVREVVANGLVAVACKNDCSGFQQAEDAIRAGSECRPFSCGNGTKEQGEICDDGDLNGTYGHCGNDCTYGGADGNAFSCGDGYLAGAEQCDCGTVANRASVIADAESWASTHAAGVCSNVSNGQYRRQGSCSFDCKLSGPSCGDGETNGPEQCDGDFIEWGGKLCANGSTCTKDEDCGAFGGVCGAGGAACPKANGYDQVRSRSCSANTCNWNAWGVCHRPAEQFCQNGVKEGSEQCDDGNNLNNDGCTNQCRLNVCGDSYVNLGVESCDNGVTNGTVCSAAYGQSCNYCTNTCQYKTVGGSFCGDGLINGGEVCDGASVRLTCIQENAEGAYEKIGVCSVNAPLNSVCGPHDEGQCLSVGVCNGGNFNGLVCNRNGHNQCGEGVQCVAPVCAANCLASCPFDFKTTSLLVQSELPGSTPVQSVDLYSYLNSEHQTPDNAVLHVPACSAATALYADVSDQNVVKPDVDVVFVTDMSGTMGSDSHLSPNGDGLSRLNVASEAIVDATEQLYNAYQGKNMRIALIGMTDPAALYHTGVDPALNLCTEEFKQNNLRNHDATEVMCNKLPNRLLTDSLLNREAIRERVSTYPVESSYGTTLVGGVNKAIDLLTGEESTPNSVKIVIIVSDGDPDSRINEGFDCDFSPNPRLSDEDRNTKVEGCIGHVRSLIVEQSGIEFYSAGIVSSTRAVQLMAALSSETCGGAFGTADNCGTGKYAFHGTSAAEIQGMYQTIIDSILGNVVEVATQNAGGVTQKTQDSVYTGSHIQLPFPKGFYCRPEPSLMPLRNRFRGTGAMNYQNFEFTYCPVH